MNPFIYTRIPIFLFGWIGLIIFTLSYRFEEDKLGNINLKSLPNNNPDNPSKTGTPG
jgi:hypothetical protein